MDGQGATRARPLDPTRTEAVHMCVFICVLFVCVVCKCVLFVCVLFIYLLASGLVCAQPTQVRVRSRVRPTRQLPRHPAKTALHPLASLSDSIPYDPVPSHPTLPTTLPATAPELALPELDGKTEKMYRGGKICLDSHFRPLWARNVPHFGIAHAMALGMGPWLAVEIPSLIEKGRCVSGVRYQLGISTGHLVLDGGRLVRVATPSAPSLTSSAGRAAHQQDCSSRGRIEDSLREVASV